METTPFYQEITPVVVGTEKVGWRFRLLIDGQGAAVDRFGLAVAALDPQYLGQVVETGGGVRMLSAQYFLFNRQGAAEERLGFPQPALGHQHPGQVAETASGAEMFGPQLFLPNR